MGSAVIDFKKHYKDSILHVDSLADLREAVAYYSSVNNLGRYLVIEDLSFLPRQAEGLLLKFVEESKLQVILLSVYDVFSDIFVSRFKMVLKYTKERTDSKFLSVASGSKQIDEALSDNTSKFDRVRYQGKLSPKCYYLDSVLSEAKNKGKIFAILE